MRPRSVHALGALVLVACLAVTACTSGDRGADTARSSGPTTPGPGTDTGQDEQTVGPEEPQEPSPSPSASPSPAVDLTDPTAPRVPTGEPVTLAFAGDVHFEGVIREHLAADPASVVGPISQTLSAADLAVVNLETAVTEGGTPAPKSYTYRAPTTAYQALQSAGVDIASVANNHGMDFGLDGLHDTLASAEAAGFPLIGAGRDQAAAYTPHRAEVDGQRIAVFGATQVLDSFALDAWAAQPDRPGLASAKDGYLDLLLDAVQAARQDSDTVVVMLHWGQERNQCPLPRQQELAQALVDAGADVIVGGHAHVLLGGGYLHGAYVDYGLGNFVFYARPGLGAHTGVLTITAAGRAITHAEWTPAVIHDGRPLPVDGAQAQEILTEKESQRQRCTELTDTPQP